MDIRKKLLIIFIMLTVVIAGCVKSNGNSHEQEFQIDVGQEQELLLNGISLTKDIIRSVYRGEENYTYEILLFSLAVNDDENNLYKGYFPFDQSKGFIFPLDKSNEVLIQVFGEKEYSFEDVFDYDQETGTYYKNLDFGWNTPYIAENVRANISDEKSKLHTKFELINLWHDIEGDPVPTAIADCEITYSINKSDAGIYLRFENIEIDSKIEVESEETWEEIQISSLKDFTPEQINKIKISEKDGDRILIDDYLSSAKIISDTEAIFIDNDYQTVRNSSQALYAEGFDDGYINSIDTNIREMEFTNFDNFQSPYSLSKSDTIVVFDDFHDDAQIKVKDIIYGYSAEDITLNGFVRKNSNYIFDVIIDPAYMHGLPLYHSDSSLGDFTINGLNIKSDTLSFKISDIDKNFQGNIEALNIDYAYGQITFDNINCTYGINSGYNSTAIIYTGTDIFEIA